MTVLATSRSEGIVNISTGSFTGAAAIVDVNIGFTPRSVKLINSTDAIIWEKIEGMAVANSVKTVTAGTTTIDTTAAITITENGFSVSAAAAAAAKALSFIAMA